MNFMKVNIKGVLLDSIEKEYEFEGKKGISYQLILYQFGKLQNIKVNKEVYDKYRYCINEELELECDIFIKGSYNLSYKG